MITYREVTRAPATELIVDKVICDRCGGELRRLATPGGTKWDGCSVGGHRRDDESGSYDLMKLVDAELCRGCQDELIDWIGAGAGPGARVRTAKEASDELSAAYAAASRARAEGASS